MLPEVTEESSEDFIIAECSIKNMLLEVEIELKFGIRVISEREMKIFPEFRYTSHPETA
jgi:hypothetical protein